MHLDKTKHAIISNPMLQDERATLPITALSRTQDQIRQQMEAKSAELAGGCLQAPYCFAWTDMCKACAGRFQVAELFRSLGKLDTADELLQSLGLRITRPAFCHAKTIFSKHR